MLHTRGAMRPSVAAASLIGRPPACSSSLTMQSRRLLNSTHLRAAYPKEGVFQPNSPPRHIPGFGPAPPIVQQPEQLRQQYDHISDSGQQQQPPPPNKWRPSFRWYNILGAIIFLGLGFSNIQVKFASLLPLQPGSEDDVEELQAMFEELDDIPLVQQLRQEQVAEGDGYKPAWREWAAYQGLQSDGRRAERLTTGPLGGSSGVAAQRIFWNETTGQLFVFVLFGAGTQGWPNVVHGGAISTICDESLGRVAIWSTEAKTAVTATLEINFMDRVTPGQWCVLLATLDAEKQAECTDRKKYVAGILACCGNGGPIKEGDSLMNIHPHATAKGLFVVPKTTPLNALPDEF